MSEFAPSSAQAWRQVLWLFTLALPVATVAWTVTHEEIFREAREYFTAQTQRGNMVRRKFFYALTCEYCFSHYVTAFFLWLTGYHLLLDDRRGYFIAFFAVTAIANVYISLFARVRVDIKSERLNIAVKEEAIAERKDA
ncbi:MAG: hypothetical protein ABIP90_07280 [Vicinamibacterales bacterium]